MRCKADDCRRSANLTTGLCPDHQYAQEVGDAAFERQTADHKRRLEESRQAAAAKRQRRK